VRDLLANDGVTITGEEETDVEGLVVEQDEVLDPYREDRWKVRDFEELNPYQGYRWEVSFAGSIDNDITGNDATGEPLEVKARATPSSDASLLATLASEHEIKGLYEQVGSPPEPSIYWKGSVGDMGFGAAQWSASERTEEGESASGPSPADSVSYADFISGVAPAVKWSEYWGQTDATVTQDGGPAKSTAVFFAKSIDKDGETTSTGTVTVTFTIEPGQRVSTDTPVIESSSGSMGSWIVAQSDGTVRVEPPVERGKRNVVSVLAVDLKIWNGQNAANPVPDPDKFSLGAFTTANLNDTDGDGIIDKDDPDVPREVDLMQLYIGGYKGLKGRVKLTIKSGSVKLWEDREKKTEIPLQNGAAYFPIPATGMNETL
jgi:hypothetical protein